MSYFFTIATVLLLVSCKSEKLDISKIDFKEHSCYGECPIFNMTILKDGSATYEAKKFNKQQGKFTAIIKQPQYDSLISLIEKTDFFSLKNNYSTLATDFPTYYLTITLENGQNKTIKDYGPNGPNALEKIYELIFSLRESQDWK